VSFGADSFQALGHTVRLLPPSYVKAYLNRSKNDANDAAVQGERKASGCALAWPGGNKPKGSQVPYITITVPSGGPRLAEPSMRGSAPRRWG
jgi:hypothetical protein